MPICALCGSDNAAGARFCRNCAASLARHEASASDYAWLAATLTSGDLAPDPAGDQPRHYAHPHPGAEEEAMDQPAPILFAG
ncbi:MAG: hypothetical protein N2378_08615, partial [Chloroflexaceae bacterium]|nr:hypothetical protein [Chloroflexaceae bacterium]